MFSQLQADAKAARDLSSPAVRADGSLESRVFAEGLQLLAVQSRAIMIPGLIASVLLGVIHGNVIGHTRIVAWIAALALTDSLNYFCCDYWARHSHNESSNWRALPAMLLTLTLTGLVWGAAPMMLDSGGHLEQERITLLFLCGVTLSTVVCFYSFSTVIVTRAVALWLPAIGYALSIGDEMNAYLALSGLIFVATTVQFGRRLSAEQLDSLYHLFGKQQRGSSAEER